MYGELPFGLREVKIAPIDAAGGVGAFVSLPRAQTLSYTDSADFEKLRGDDTIIAVAEKEQSTDFELEAGGISLEAYAVLTGLTAVEAGVTPNRTKTIERTTSVRRPYFQAKGRAISESGGDIEVVLFKCKASEIEGELKDGEFFMTSCSGECIGDGTGKVWSLKQKETAAALP
ncbi:MAG: major tail protein [Candidatus Aquicultorales bacterium]